MTLRVSYDYSAGRYRLSWTLRRNGDALPERGSTEGLLMDDVADLVAVILSSCARDDASPFEG